MSIVKTFKSIDCNVLKSWQQRLQAEADPVWKSGMEIHLDAEETSSKNEKNIKILTAGLALQSFPNIGRQIGFERD